MNDDILSDLYNDPKRGFMGLNELIKQTRIFKIPEDYVREWYKKQDVNQIIVRRREPIIYHKTIGDGHGYQADIIFFQYPKLNDGFIGLLTFINTSTRRAFVAAIKNRTTEELIEKIEVWIDHIRRTWGPIKSITTDNELFNNREIANLFADNDIEQFVEVSGEHTKLGIINRFHRTIRNLLNKVMTYKGSKRWIDFISDVMHNYNHRVHKTLGKAPINMTMDDVKLLNQKLINRI